MASTMTWDKLNPFSPPAHGTQIVMPSGTYTLMRGMYGWSLYDEDSNSHPEVHEIDAMVNLLAQIYRIGNSENFVMLETQEVRAWRGEAGV